MSFRLFVCRGEQTPSEKTKIRHAKRRKDEKNAKRKDEITPCERTKPATRKDEISARKDEKKKTPCEKTPFETLILSSFRVASFHFFAWRLFVFSSDIIRLFATKRRNGSNQPP